MPALPKTLMIALVAAFAALGLTVQTTPARAEGVYAHVEQVDWRHRGPRHYDRPRYYYPPPRAYYAPPPRYYYPPPPPVYYYPPPRPRYYAPPPSVGLYFRF